MQLEELDFVKLLPEFMKKDEADKALAEAVSKMTQELASKIHLYSTWDKIDEMSTAELDLLAEELDIIWYDKNARKEIKKELIKQSDMIHAKLGTNWACLQVVEKYFGESKIVEWFDYNGQPGHFRITTLDQSIMSTKMNQFLDILNKVKRKSAHLDEIVLEADAFCNIIVHVGAYDYERIICKCAIGEVPDISIKSYAEQDITMASYQYDKEVGYLDATI